MEDKFFLLDPNEIVKYFPIEDERKMPNYWWFRYSWKNKYQAGAGVVRAEGNISFINYCGPDMKSVYVRPAVWIKI